MKKTLAILLSVVLILAVSPMVAMVGTADSAQKVWDQFFVTSEGANVTACTITSATASAKGTVTFTADIPAGGYAQFNQKLTDLIGGGATVCIKIGNGTTDDYLAANVQAQLTADAAAKTDIVPVNEYAGQDPGTAGMTWLFYGSTYIYSGRGNTTAGGGLYASAVSAIADLGGITFKYNLEEDGKVSYKSTTAAGFSGTLPSTKTAEEVGLTDGAYFRVRNNAGSDVTYTVTIKSKDIKAAYIDGNYILSDLDSKITDSSVTYNAGNATYTATVSLSGSGSYVQLNKKLTDIIGGGATVCIKIGNGTTDDYLAANVQAQLTADAAAKTDIVPVNEYAGQDPGTAGMTWLFYGSTYIYSGRGNTTAGGGLYASAVSAIADLGGITFKYNLEEDGKVSYKSTTAAGFSGTLPSTKTAEEVGLTDGAYFRLRNAGANAVTYTLTITTVDTEERLITVTGGTPSVETAGYGTSVILTPGEAPAGHTFVGWNVVRGGVEVVDNAFVMASDAVEVEAVYEKIPYTLTKDGALQDGTYYIGDTVTLEDAEVPSDAKFVEFDKWVIVSGEGAKIDGNVLTIGAGNVEIKATYKAVAPYEDIRDLVRFDELGEDAPGVADSFADRYAQEGKVTIISIIAKLLQAK